MITLYTTHCPKCKVIEKKLDALNKEYTIVDNKEEILEFSDKVGINSAPILDVDGEVMDFASANKYVNSL